MAAWRSKRENEKVEIHVYTIEAARVKKNTLAIKFYEIRYSVSMSMPNFVHFCSFLKMFSLAYPSCTSLIAQTSLHSDIH